MNTLKLADPIATYFDLERNHPDHLARCFAAHAIVVDEGRTYTGLDAIKAWKAAATAQYTYTNEPFECEQNDGLHIVTSHVAGNFPGSPVDLKYRFRVEGDTIVSLEITV